MNSADKPTLHPITPEQLRDARTLFGWSRDRLAMQSNTTLHFIGASEETGRVGRFLWHPEGFDALNAIRTVLESAGVELVDDNGNTVSTTLKARL